MILEIPGDRDFFMTKVENLHQAVFYTEGTGGKPSSHKSDLATRAFGFKVEPIGIRGPEPSHISDPLDLILSKWWLFHQNAVEDHSLEEGGAIEIVADVACAYGVQNGSGFVDARKEKGIDMQSFGDRQKELARRVSGRMSRFGNNNVVARMDAALVVAHSQYGERGGSIVSSGVSKSSVLLPGNPFRDKGLVAEYIDWSGLGEKHISSIPWGIDVATAVGFLAHIDWWGKQGYVFDRTDDLVGLPASYIATHSDSPKYIESGLEFFYDQKRLPEGILDAMDTSTLVGLLNVAFNFPMPFVGELVDQLNNEKVKPNQVIYLNPIIHN